MRLIDADALMAEMKEYRSEQEKEQMYSGDRGVCVTWNDAMFFIKNAPTIEPEPSQVARDIATIIENEKDMRVIGERKRGKWVHGREIGRDKIGDCIIAIFYDGWECSSCGCLVEESREPLYKFCPHCGADMREE